MKSKCCCPDLTVSPTSSKQALFTSNVFKKWFSLGHGELSSLFPYEVQTPDRLKEPPTPTLRSWIWKPHHTTYQTYLTPWGQMGLGIQGAQILGSEIQCACAVPHWTPSVGPRAVPHDPSLDRATLNTHRVEYTLLSCINSGWVLVQVKIFAKVVKNFKKILCCFFLFQNCR